jgi:hypothetical protein
MGVRYEYFAATTDELLKAAPGWVLAEYGPFAERTRVNPFTGVRSTSWGFELLTAAPEGAEDEQIVNLLKEHERASFRDLTEPLAALVARLVPNSAEERAKLGRYALVGPQEADCAVGEIPDAMTAALAALTPEQLEEVACSVQSDCEMDESLSGVVSHLAKVARRAVSTDRRMFYYMSL